jgi:orotate phosphoribosyltransferase
MMDLPDKETRVALANHAQFKANIYKEVDSTLFIESSIHQAQAIAELTGKPVFCTETWQMINADRLTRFRNRSADYVSVLRKDPFNALKKLGRFSIAALRSLKWKMLARFRK